METGRRISSEWTGWLRSSDILIGLYWLWGLASKLTGIWWPTQNFSVPELAAIMLITTPWSLYSSFCRCDVFETDSGFIIERRRFWRRESIFVPVENVRDIRITSFLSLDTGRWCMEFENETLFGKRIPFQPAESDAVPRYQLLYGLRRKIAASKDAESIGGMRGGESYRIVAD